MRIIYKTPEDTVSIIVPSPEWSGTIEELAQKDVPTGLKYKIVEDSDIPSDRSFRNAWEVDEAKLQDGVGGELSSSLPIPDKNKVTLKQDNKKVNRNDESGPPEFA